MIKKYIRSGALFCCWIILIKKVLKSFNCENSMAKFLPVPNPAVVLVFMPHVTPKKTAL
jgi:hypothetical protein